MDTQPEIQLNSALLFFFHMDNKKLNPRTVLRDGMSLFQQSENVQETREYWLETKDELTQEYKKKHKTAYKRTAKLRKGVGNKRV